MTESEITRCEDALRLLAAHLDGELAGTEHAEVERHLSKCRSCFSRAEFEKRLKTRLEALRRESVQSELSNRIRSMIQRFDVAGGKQP